MSKRFRSSKCSYSNQKEKIDLQCSIQNLPPEILIDIFSYIPNHDLCLSVRCVSRQWGNLCQSVVNKKFLTLQQKIRDDIKNVSEMLDQQKMKDMKSLCLGRDYMEHVQMDYEMTLALVWRYCYSTEPMMCMFGGKLVDLINQYLLKDPKNRTHLELLVIRATVKSFQDFFQDHIEKKLNEDWRISGAKLIDILDCLKDRIKGKTVENEEVDYEAGVYKLKCNYTLHGAWFCALDKEKHRTYKNHYRYIAHSLRRLVVKRNLYALYDYQKLRQKKTFNQFFLPNRSFSYSGFQHFGCLSYGCMNNSEYHNRVHTDLIPFGEEEEDQNEVDDDDDDEGAEEEQHEDGITPMISIDISATLLCPIEVAPKSFLTSLSQSRLLSLRSRKKLKDSDQFFLKLQIYCACAMLSKLPSLFTWTSDV